MPQQSNDPPRIYSDVYRPMLADVTQQQRQQSNAMPGPGCSLAPAPAGGSQPSSRASTPAVSPVAVSLTVPTNPLLVPEYHQEIVRHLMLREQQSGGAAIDPSYLTNQPEVTERMRSILVDWLVDVTLKFKLHPETFFLNVNIIDRYLSRHQAQRSRLQLIGITGCLIASKHEQIWPPEVRDCVYIAANTYTAQEILECEREIASALHFRFTVPTCYPILCYLLDNSEMRDYSRNAALFFLESSAHDYRMLQFRPSRVACACLLLGHVLLEYNSAMAGSGVADDTNASSSSASSFFNRPVSGAEIAAQMWDSWYVQLSEGVTYGELLPVAEQLLQSTALLSSQTSRLQAVRRKYLQPRFGAVASLSFPPTISS
jgi:cyclin A